MKKNEGKVAEKYFVDKFVWLLLDLKQPMNIGRTESHMNNENNNKILFMH